MSFDCSKPLGDELELYLQNDINKICDELNENGIVYEHQFKSLWSMVCKQNSLELVKLFSKKTGLDIFYAYDNETINFVFYDTRRFTMKKAEEMSKIYHKANGY